MGFKDKGLTVETKNGKVYVSMEAKLLFASGKYTVDNEGKDALIKLAKILETQTDLEVLVEGHTDTDALKSPNVPTDNWELSVLRSTSVVKLMLKESKMNPKKITAAGRSEFLPVDPNDKAKTDVLKLY
jgi:chemotaxis protein MotB